MKTQEELAKELHDHWEEFLAAVRKDLMIDE